MFKKIPHYNFLEKVSTRVFSKINTQAKLLGKLALNKCRGYLFSFIISTLCFFGIFIAAPALTTVCIGFLVFVLFSVFSIKNADYYYSEYLILKNLMNIQSIEDSYYEYISQSDEFKNIPLLTNEEIKELLSVSLNQHQVDYLQKMIVEQKNLNLEHLLHLSSLLTEEEKKKIEYQEKKEALDEFISKHQLENHHSNYLLIDNKEILRETQLSSKL